MQVNQLAKKKKEARNLLDLPVQILTLGPRADSNEEKRERKVKGKEEYSGRTI